MTFGGTLKKNVFLVGFMGVGKTPVARRMARDMGVACVDVDAFLERKHGKSAAELFGELGEDALRELEYEALVECANMGPSLISCGEGIVAYDTTNNSESRILTDTLAPFLQDDVSCVTLIVTDHQVIAVAADLNSETQTVYRYEI